MIELQCTIESVGATLSLDKLYVDDYKCQFEVAARVHGGLPVAVAAEIVCYGYDLARFAVSCEKCARRDDECVAELLDWDGNITLRVVFWKRSKTGARRLTVGGRMVQDGLGSDSPHTPTFLSQVTVHSTAGIAILFDGFETESDRLLNFVGQLRESVTELGLDFNDPDAQHLSN